MKNAFSLYTFLPSVFGGLCLGCTESHAKNITSPKKYIFNLPLLVFYVLEKSLSFCVHLYTDTSCAQCQQGLRRCTESFFSLYTSAHLTN
jgi:hypothetical protein